MKRLAAAIASSRGGGGGGGTSIYGLDRHVPPDRVGFFRPVVGYHFCPGWHCVRGVILWQGNQMLSTK